MLSPSLKGPADRTADGATDRTADGAVDRTADGAVDSIADGVVDWVEMMRMSGLRLLCSVCDAVSHHSK
jgi:hypothetical protein